MEMYASENSKPQGLEDNLRLESLEIDPGSRRQDVGAKKPPRFIHLEGASAANLAGRAAWRTRARASRCGWGGVLCLPGPAAPAGRREAGPVSWGARGETHRILVVLFIVMLRCCVYFGMFA